MPEPFLPMQVIFQNCEPVNTSRFQELLANYGLGDFPQVTSIPKDYKALVLRWDAEGLSLYAAAEPGVSPTRVDFLSGAVRHRLATSRKTAGLLKAAGLDKFREPPRVLDATAGLGIDAYSLAAMGCQVTLVEKSPVMAALLADGLQRGLATGDAVILANLQRMSLHVTDANIFMGQIQDSGRPDVILLDPMFPPRQKSARVKKDMALMQQLLPANDDIESLLASARKLARKRVVLKQPGKDSRHADPKPDFQVPGKACHFQVFLTG